MNVKCPRCGQETDTAANPFRPFCSERCKMIDLGNWIQGAYRIPTRDADEDEDGQPSGEEDPAEK
jgi:endogenous inhibitor of DNA gyrase (YacG/DUF329 family)